MPPAPSTAQSGVPESALLRALQSSQSFPVGRESLLLEYLSLLVDLYATTLVALWGSTPITISMLSTLLCARDHCHLAYGGQSDFG
jgi:hypothetical protein